jgi:phosphoglycolate phosphatase
MKKLIIFDFDGTLADVESLGIKIYNDLAAEFHYDPITESELPGLKQIGAKQFIKQKIGFRPWAIPKIIRRGLREYKKQISKVILFPGVTNIIPALKERGIRVGILSSNDPTTIQEVLKRYNVEVDFINQSSLFGKASKLKKILRKEMVTVENALYIGDELRDVEACKKINLDIIAVSWGLNSKESLEKTGVQVADSYDDILKLSLI